MPKLVALADAKEQVITVTQQSLCIDICLTNMSEEEGH